LEAVYSGAIHPSHPLSALTKPLEEAGGPKLANIKRTMPARAKEAGSHPQ
jgi:hypothetical protein